MLEVQSSPSRIGVSRGAVDNIVSPDVFLTQWTISTLSATEITGVGLLLPLFLMVTRGSHHGERWPVLLWGAGHRR